MMSSRPEKNKSRQRTAILENRNIRADETISKHADWADGLKQKYAFTPDNADEILKKEIGLVFADVLSDAGVFKKNAEGDAAFLRFISQVK